MFDDADKNQQLLPAYPSSIKGELRIILQVKDQFLLCFKHLENLSNLWDHQNQIITKDFVFEQIMTGDSEIEQLKQELQAEKDAIIIKERHNDGLILELQSRGEHFIADTSKRRVKACKMALFKSCQVDLTSFLHFKDTSFVAVLQNIGERIDAAQNELRLHMRPILEFYKDLFYLQLHFTLALTQISCFCMPLMTDSISLVDRLFFWTERPEFELIRRSGRIYDRLRDIYTRLQRIMNRLFDSVSFLQERIDLQRSLEIKFYEKMKQISEAKDDILENIHSNRIHSDLLEEENDRLVGTLIKIDPSFPSSEAFKFYAALRHSSSSTNKGKKQSSNADGKLKKNPSKKNPSKIGKVESDTNGSEYTISSENSVNNNMSSLPKNMLPEGHSSNETKGKLWKFKRQIESHLSSTEAEDKMNGNNALKFNNIEVERERDFNCLSSPLSKRCQKYKLSPLEDVNQTTDAFIMTSEILPKDD